MSGDACRRQEAEVMLTEWASMSRSRDERVRLAVTAGVSKNRVHTLTGIGRTTIDRILAADVPGRDQGAEYPR
jgi:hypothetical protein